MLVVLDIGSWVCYTCDSSAVVKGGTISVQRRFELRMSDTASLCESDVLL